MSAPVRQVLLVSVLAVVLLVKAQQPGAFLSLGGNPEAFPRDVVARAAPTPNVYSDRPAVRVLQLLDSMNTMWAGAFADAGARYEDPRVQTVEHETAEGCGSTVGGWAGIYCRDTKSIAIDLSDHLVGRAAVGDDEADLLLGYILAHEVGHHVQALRGFSGLKDQVLRAELHAQCLAGVWGRASGRPPRPPWSFGVDADHGSADQQARWLGRGHAAGRPGDCDGVWTASPP
jgi:predicted metalloprotease